MKQLNSKILVARKETHDVKTLRLDVSSQGFKFKPGQHTILTIGPNLVKPLSISCSPTKKDYIEVSKKITESEFSKKFDSLKEGAEVKIQGPLGGFVFDDKLKNATMLCGGIGITPIRSMLQYVTDKKIPCKIILFYSNKTPQDIAFFEELKELSEKNKNLKLILTITRNEESERKWSGIVGRIDEKLVSKNVLSLDDTTFFVCGPPSMVSAMVDLLKSLNVPEEKIRMELFTGYK